MKNLLPSLSYLALSGLLQTASADLLYHWTFDTDGGQAAGDIGMNFAANAAISDSCSIIGEGSLFINSENAPATGGAITDANINWSAFQNGDERTIAFWARMAAPQEKNATMFSTGGGGDGNRFDVKVNEGNYRVEVQGGGYSTSANVIDGAWHHFAVVIPDDEALMGDVLYYLDGNLIDTTANTNTRAISTATSTIRIGDSVNAAVDRDVNGHIDDVRVYNNALSAIEIQNLYNASRMISCFEGESESIFTGGTVDFTWESSAQTSLVITNDQDATTIDALAIGANGTTTLTPTTTTTYTVTADGGADRREFTVEVKFSPDITSFTSAPTLTYGSGPITLNWTTEEAGRIEITDDQGSTPIVYTATSDTQEFLNSGSVEIPSISTTTVYTLSTTFAEDGSGEVAQLQSTAEVQTAPDLTLIAVPSTTDGTEPVTLHFNATIIQTSYPVTGAAGTITDFNDDADPNNGFDVKDTTKDFDTLLAGLTALTFEVTNGDNPGRSTPILSFSGDTLTLEEDLGNLDLSWTTYRIISTTSAGADLLEISDGTSIIFSTSDPNVISNGSYPVGVVSSDTTFTATASIVGAGSTQDTAEVVTTAGGSTYEEVILSQSPLGYFRFEESSGSSIVYDSSGNGNHSTTIDNPEFFTSGEEGIIGNGGTFDEPANVGASVVTGINLSPASSSFSITALIQPEEILDGTANIVSNRDGSGVGRSLLFLGADDATPRSFVGNTFRPNSDAALNLLTPYPFNAICHLGVTYEATTGTIRIYLDGTLVALSEGIAGEAADGFWVIGAHKSNLIDAFWNGILDEIAVFDTVLTSAQIEAQNDSFLANSGSGILAFGYDSEIFLGESVDLFAKIGARSTSASIDNGIGSVAVGESNSITVSPTVDTTYTLTVDGETQSVTITVLPPETITITNCGFDTGGNFFLEVAEGVTGFKVTQSPDLSTDFQDATGVSNDGNSRFTINSSSLDSNNDGMDYFRVEAE